MEIGDIQPRVERFPGIRPFDHEIQSWGPDLNPEALFDYLDHIGLVGDEISVSFAPRDQVESLLKTGITPQFERQPVHRDKAPQISIGNNEALVVCDPSKRFLAVIQPQLEAVRSLEDLRLIGFRASQAPQVPQS